MNRESLPIPSRSPRRAMYSAAQGAYSLVVRADRPVAYRGDVINLQLFISGYGKIFSPKLYIVMPKGFHDLEQSHLHYGFDKDTDGLYRFGVKKMPLVEVTTVILGGIKNSTWPIDEEWDGQHTLMFDARTPDPPGLPDPIVLTEQMTMDRPPVRMEIKLNSLRFWQSTPMKSLNAFKNRLRPGKYAVQFVFSYYNGNEWVSQPLVHELELHSWFKRRELLTWSITLGVAVSAVLVAMLTIPGVAKVLWG